MSFPGNITTIITSFAITVLCFAQVDGPFLTDEHTLGLWHLDQSEPDSVWAVTVGGGAEDICRRAVKTSDGEYVIAGYTNSFGKEKEDILLVRMDEEGDTLWMRTYGTDEYDYCYDLVELPDGNLALAGSSGRRGRNNFLLMVTNADGDSLWSRTYGGDSYDECYTILVDDDGGFLLGGSAHSFGAGMRDMWVVKVDSAGEQIWAHPYGGERNETCESIVKTRDNGYILAGYTSSVDAGSQGYLVRIDNRGEVVWERTYGSPYSDRIRKILPSDSGYVCAGYNSATFWLFEIDDDGEVLWDETYLGITYYNVYDVILTMDKGYLIVGAFRSNQGDYDFAMLKTDYSGDLVWLRGFGGDLDDKIYSVVQNEDAGYTFFGTTESFGGGEEDAEDWLILRSEPDLVLTYDLSGHGIHGSAHGTVGSAEGLWGGALELTDSSNGCILVDDNELLRMNTFTVEGWFLMNDSIPHTGAIICKEFDAEFASYMLYASSEFEFLGFALITEISEPMLEVDANPADGQWHHIAGTYDGETARLFYDGIMIGDLAVGEPIIYDENPLIIGSNESVNRGEFQFLGRIDEVRLSDVLRDYLNVFPSDRMPVQSETLRLFAAYPNPFNNRVTLRFTLNEPTATRLEILDLSGRRLELLGEGGIVTGNQVVVWDGSKSPSGFYLAKLTCTNTVSTVRILLLK